MLRALKSLWRDTRGLTAVEFGLIAPILAIVATGTIEFGRMILITQKLQNGTFILADLAARDETLSVGQLDNLFLAVNNIMQPFEFDELGVAVVTSLTVDDDGDPIISWQRRGAGDSTAASEIGGPGDVGDLPEDFTLETGETLIVGELFYEFEPLFDAITEPQTLRRVAYVKPRLGTLDTLLP